MNTFITLFIVALVFTAVPLGLLGTINAIRKRQPGCSGTHDCVVYKGEKVMCPSCEIKELKAEIAAAKQAA